MPEHLSFEEAAAIPLVALTAWQARGGALRGGARRGARLSQAEGGACVWMSPSLHARSYAVCACRLLPWILAGPGRHCCAAGRPCAGSQRQRRRGQPGCSAGQAARLACDCDLQPAERRLLQVRCGNAMGVGLLLVCLCHRFVIVGEHADADRVPVCTLGLGARLRLLRPTAPALLAGSWVPMRRTITVTRRCLPSCTARAAASLTPCLRLLEVSGAGSTCASCVPWHGACVGSWPGNHDWAGPLTSCEAHVC